MYSITAEDLVRDDICMNEKTRSRKWKIRVEGKKLSRGPKKKKNSVVTESDTFVWEAS